MAMDFFRKLFGRTLKPSNEDAQDLEDEEAEDSFDPFPDGVVVEIRDVFDLHSIPPRQVRAVVEEYLDEAHKRGFRFVRIIHGKGIGVQREIVRSVLARKPFVIDFKDAPPEAGGWGATVVTLAASAESKDTT